MSGGSYNYFYRRVEEFAADVSVRALGRPERVAFSRLLLKVAKAAHDIEWVDSSDYAGGDELEAIRACLQPEAELEAARSMLEDAIKAATAVLERAR